MMALALLMVVAVLVAGLWALMHLAGAPVALDTSQRTVPATGPITFDLYRVGSRNTYDNQRQRTPSTLTVHNGRISAVHPDGHVWLNKPVGRVRVTIGATGYVTLGPFLAVSEFPPDPSRASSGPELDLARRITLALQGLIPIESPGAPA